MFFQLTSRGRRRDPAERFQRLEAIGLDLGFVRRHHLGDGRTAGLEPDEEEAAPGLQLHRDEAELGRVQPGIVALVRNSDQPAVEGVGPGVIGAGQPPRAARDAGHQPRAAVAADVREGSHLAVVAAKDDDALAEIFDRPPVARGRNVAHVADDLPGRADHPLHLDLEIIRIAIDPAGKAELRLGGRCEMGAGHGDLSQKGGPKSRRPGGGWDPGGSKAPRISPPWPQPSRGRRFLRLRSRPPSPTPVP